MLLALFLACWRWLMPLAAAIVAPVVHIVRARPLASLPVVPRPGHTLALIHAPPLRLLT